MNLRPSIMRPLRIWPALVLLAFLAAAKSANYLAEENSYRLFMFALFTPLVVGLGILLWWSLASRATGRERWLGPLAVILVSVATYLLLDPTIKGMGFLFFVVPTGVAAVGLRWYAQPGAAGVAHWRCHRCRRCRVHGLGPDAQRGHLGRFSDIARLAVGADRRRAVPGQP